MGRVPTNASVTPGWRTIEVPLPVPPEVVSSDRMRAHLSHIAGALALWSSRIHEFDPRRYPNAATIAAYCVDRLAGNRVMARPGADVVRLCLREVAEQIDPVAYRALNELLLAFRSMEATASSGDDTGFSLEVASAEEASLKASRFGEGPHAQVAAGTDKALAPALRMLVDPPAPSDAPAGSLLSAGSGELAQQAEALRRRLQERRARRQGPDSTSGPESGGGF